MDIEKKYKNDSRGKEEALEEVGLRLRRYQQIKKSIKDVYGSLEEAIKCRCIYFTEPKKYENIK